MNKDTLKNRYLGWLMTVLGIKHRFELTPIIFKLFDTDFTYTIPRDGNRYEDGIDLRYRFGEANHIDSCIIANQLDIYPCSVLEMMTALCMRIETHITGDFEQSDRTFELFQMMLKNAGLWMPGEKFNERLFEKRLDDVLDHRYDADGQGGFFTLKKPAGDMRKAELWYQAMWFLDEQLKLV